MKKEEYLSLIDEVIAQGPYTDTWDSLCEHPTPKWYARDKFGIFIHWGVYSVPAFGNEWYPRNMYVKGSKENLHHTEKYGTLDKFGYKDFIPQFKAEKSQATRQEQIMAKAKEYGIPETFAKRYAIPDDVDLDIYFKDAKQELANIGFSGVTPPESAETKMEKEAESIANMISEGTKTIVESKK